MLNSLIFPGFLDKWSARIYVDIMRYTLPHISFTNKNKCQIPNISTH